METPNPSSCTIPWGSPAPFSSCLTPVQELSRCPVTDFRHWLHDLPLRLLRTPASPGPTSTFSQECTTYSHHPAFAGTVPCLQCPSLLSLVAKILVCSYQGKSIPSRRNSSCKGLLMRTVFATFQEQRGALRSRKGCILKVRSSDGRGFSHTEFLILNPVETDGKLPYGYYMQG